MADRLDPDAARRILARAAEIDLERGDHPVGYERDALTAAADEVGIAPDAVRMAMAEHATGALSDTPTTRNLLGPSVVRVVATVPRPAPAVAKMLDRWMRSQMLTIARRHDGATVWHRRRDVVAKIRRKVDFARTVQLDNIDELTLATASTGEGSTIVRFEADLTNTRRGLWTGAVGVPAAVGPLAGLAIGMLAQEPLLVATGVPMGAALGGGGFLLGRKTLADGRAEAQRVLELVLSEIS